MMIMVMEMEEEEKEKGEEWKEHEYFSYKPYP